MKLLLLALLSFNAEAVQVIDTKGMKCNFNNSQLGIVYKCENKEIVCYSIEKVEDGKLYCFPKKEKSK